MRQVIEIPRTDLRATLDRLTDHRPDGKPVFPIFSALATRRQPLYLRYPPINEYDNGPLARVGDHCLLTDKGANVIRDIKGRSFTTTPTTTRESAYTRRGEKIILEDAGTERWMILKNYDKDNPLATKHWTPKEDGKLNYDPADHDLYLFRGMYNDSVKGNGMIGRFGQWRSHSMLCLRSLRTIRTVGVEFRVVDPVN